MQGLVTRDDFGGKAAAHRGRAEDTGVEVEQVHGSPFEMWW
jgi:hypothetical protein